MINKILAKMFGTRITMRTASGATLKAPLKSERDFDVAFEWLSEEYFRRGYGNVNIVQVNPLDSRTAQRGGLQYDFDLFSE